MSLSGTKVKEEREVSAKEESAFSFSASDWKNLLWATTLRRWGLLERGKAKLHTSQGRGRNASLAVPKLRGFFFPPFVLGELSSL